MYEQACAHALLHASCSNIYLKNMMASAPSVQLPRLRFELFQQLVKERDGHTRQVTLVKLVRSHVQVKHAITSQGQAQPTGMRTWVCQVSRLGKEDDRQQAHMRCAHKEPRTRTYAHASTSNKHLC